MTTSYGGLPREKFFLARSKARKHSGFTNLINEVELALRIPSPETLFSDILMQKSCAIAKDVAADLDVTPDFSSPSLRYAIGDPD